MLDAFPDDDNPTRRDTREVRDKPRWGRRVLIVLASFVALVLVASAGFYVFLDRKAASNITQERLLPQSTPSVSGKPVPVEGVGQNYLIIGADTQPGDAGRSDVIVLAHVQEDKSAVQLIHFPRDLYVDIPGRKKDKINAAFAYGGAPLLVETVQNLLGVKIDHVAKTDFQGFQRMTDAVGGVRVYAEEASEEGSFTVHEGWNDLNGEQALAFVRERYELSEGDISRGKRQMAFIKALMTKTLTPSVIANPVTLTKFVDAATSNLVVDESLDVGAMRNEAIGLRNLRRDDIVFITAPFTGFGTAPDGGSIDLVDEAGMKALGDALRTDTMDDYADAYVAP